MKHIKLFEEISKESVDVGDYIETDKNYFINKKTRVGKIVRNEFSMDTLMYNIILNTGQDMWITQDMIVRKLTPDEIEKYEIELNANKYNL